MLALNTPCVEMTSSQPCKACGMSSGRSRQSRPYSLSAVSSRDIVVTGHVTAATIITTTMSAISPRMMDGVT
jgi:hypothetical protein